jgi:hypothetical protein
MSQKYADAEKRCQRRDARYPADVRAPAGFVIGGFSTGANRSENVAALASRAAASADEIRV